VSPELQTALVGAIGGLAGQYLVVAGELDRGRWPMKIRRWPFWAATAAWMLTAAFVAWLEGPLPKLPSFEVGIGVKLFLNALGHSVPTKLGSDDPVN
jgi:hypothetical protein